VYQWFVLSQLLPVSALTLFSGIRVKLALKVDVPPSSATSVNVLRLGMMRPDGNDGFPVVLSTLIASCQAVPSADTLTWKLSSPIRPTSARPE
jgi:hypothetical protein